MRLARLAPLAGVVALLASGCAKKLSDFETFACANDKTCPTGYTCVDNTCRTVVAGGACTTASSDPCTSLGSSYRCQNGLCTSIQEGSSCNSSSSTDVCKDVNPLLACVYGYDRCLRTGCDHGVPCGPSSACVNDTCLPSCTGGAACESGDHCELTSAGAVCFPHGMGPGGWCANSYDCPNFTPSLTCASATCRLSCGATVPCPTGTRCTNGACLSDCGNGGACPSGLACVSLGTADGAKVCATAGTGAGATCKSATDCAPGLGCNAGVCGAPCGSDATCEAGSVCTGSIGASICVKSCASATCPTGTTCQDYTQGKRLCLPPTQGIGTPCVTTCPAAELACDDFLCGLPCASGAGCPAGQVCSKGSGAGACLFDCTSSGTCPSGSNCQPIRWTSKSACEQNGFTLPACQSVTKTSDCALCGPSYELPAASAVHCSGSGASWSCPAFTTCGSASTFGCTCYSGYTAKSCAGTACSNADAGCSWPSWSCVPNTPPTPSCWQSPINAGGSCRCLDGRQPLFECGSSESCQKLCADGCSIALQDCGAGKKCSLIVSDGGYLLGGSESECVAEGSATVGQACTRTAPGVDTCAKGDYCTRVAPAGTLVCRKLCRRDTDCGASEACVNDGYFDSYPTYGMCLQRCSPSATPNGFGSCPTGMGCSFLNDVDNASAVPACRQLGTNAVNTSCAFDGECGNEVECVNGSCRQECGPSRACSAGSCHPFTDTSGTSSGAGYCL